MYYKHKDYSSFSDKMVLDENVWHIVNTKTGPYISIHFCPWRPAGANLNEDICLMRRLLWPLVGVLYSN